MPVCEKTNPPVVHSVFCSNVLMQLVPVKEIDGSTSQEIFTVLSICECKAMVIFLSSLVVSISIVVTRDILELLSLLLWVPF